MNNIKKKILIMVLAFATLAGAEPEKVQSSLIFWLYNAENKDDDIICIIKNTGEYNITSFEKDMKGTIPAKQANDIFMRLERICQEIGIGAFLKVPGINQRFRANSFKYASLNKLWIWDADSAQMPAQLVDFFNQTLAEVVKGK